MDMIAVWALLVGLVLVAGVSKRIRNTAITLPMLYVLFGLAVGVLFSQQIRLTFDDPIVEVIATLTLALVLATDASRIKLKRPVSNYTLPLRLLGIGLPLTIALGAVLAAALFGQLGIWEAAVLAVILAPTDASLGQSVVSNKRVPARIRQGLNIESGLNDGIAMPFLILTLSLAVSSEQQLGSGIFLLITARQIGFGVLAGLLVGFLGARYIRWGDKSGWMSRGFQKICWLALIIIAYGTAVLIGGNGFIASFVFGITSGRSARFGESQPEHRAVCPSKSDRRSYDTGGYQLAGGEATAGERAVRGLVRAARHRFHPVRPDRCRRRRSFRQRYDLHSGHDHHIFECVGPWFYGRAPIRPVWQTHRAIGQERCGRFGNEAGTGDAYPWGNRSGGHCQRWARHVIPGDATGAYLTDKVA
jgi:hypothetical protein